MNLLVFSIDTHTPHSSSALSVLVASGELDRYASYQRQRALSRAQGLASQRARATATAGNATVTARATEAGTTTAVDVGDSPVTDQPSSPSSSSSPPLGWLGHLSSLSRYLTVQALFLVLQIRRQVQQYTSHLHS